MTELWVIVTDWLVKINILLCLSLCDAHITHSTTNQNRVPNNSVELLGISKADCFIIHLSLKDKSNFGLCLAFLTSCSCNKNHFSELVLTFWIVILFFFVVLSTDGGCQTWCDWCHWWHFFSMSNLCPKSRLNIYAAELFLQLHLSSPHDAQTQRLLWRISSYACSSSPVHWSTSLCHRAWGRWCSNPDWPGRISGFRGYSGWSGKCPPCHWWHTCDTDPASSCDFLT